MTGSGVGTPLETAFPGAITLNNLVSMVRKKARDNVRPGTYHFTGDGTTTSFKLPFVNIEEGSDTITLDDVSTTEYSLDVDTGDIEFDTAPTTGADIFVSCRHSHFSEDSVVYAINAAIDYVTDYFYQLKTDTSITTTANDYEYLVPSDVDVITKVELYDGLKYYPRNNWHTMKSGDNTYVIFKNIPEYINTMRITYTVKTSHLIELDDTLEGDAHLPDKCIDPLVLYAVFNLKLEDLAGRVASDGSHNLMDENAVSSQNIDYAIQRFKIVADMALQTNRMHPIMRDRIVRG